MWANFVVFCFWRLNCPCDVILKLFVCFFIFYFMMCRSFDGRYVCVACGKHWSSVCVALSHAYKFEFLKVWILFFWGVYSRLIVNSIHYIFFIHFYLFHLLFLIISILSNFICMFILSITSQFSNLSILFITSQLLWCCESWIFVLYWFYFVVYASVLFGFYCCPCPWSIVSKSLFWRNILQNQRWIQLTTFNKK
jgi:hypothetical protein